MSLMLDEFNLRKTSSTYLTMCKFSASLQNVKNSSIHRMVPKNPPTWKIYDHLRIGFTENEVTVYVYRFCIHMTQPTIQERQKWTKFHRPSVKLSLIYSVNALY